MQERDQSLAGKTVLITGGARRVGAAIARELHAAGANLAIHYRKSAGDAEALAASSMPRGRDRRPRCRPICWTSRGCRRWWSSRYAASAALDVLVNNASTFYATKVGEITPAAWDDLLGTNLKAPLFLSQAAAPALRKSRRADPQYRRYPRAAPAAALHGVLRRQGRAAHAHAFAGQGAGARDARQWHRARTRAVARRPGRRRSMRAKIIERTILKRMGTPADIARTALFFAAHAPFITGQILAVDGGRSVAW